MRILLFFICMISSVLLQAQDSSSRRITVNNLKEGSREKLLEVVFKYPQFVNSKLVYRDNAVMDARLNYHRLNEQMFFINAKGDTMILAQPEIFSMFILDQDTFFYSDKAFPYLITHFPEVNLVKKEFISLVGKEKKGLYGTYSAVSSVNSERTFTTDEMPQVTWLNLDENAVYKKESKFLLKDKHHNFFMVNKKNFYNLFSKQEKELKEYLQTNKIDFTKEEDLRALMDFLNGVKKEP
ncbi:MAG: hypothetical protein ACXWB9_06065 [Flavisolibacter sp.]